MKTFAYSHCATASRLTFALVMEYLLFCLAFVLLYEKRTINKDMSVFFSCSGEGTPLIGWNNLRTT